MSKVDMRLKKNQGFFGRMAKNSEIAAAEYQKKKKAEDKMDELERRHNAGLKLTDLQLYNLKNARPHLFVTRSQRIAEIRETVRSNIRREARAELMDKAFEENPQFEKDIKLRDLADSSTIIGGFLETFTVTFVIMAALFFVLTTYVDMSDAVRDHMTYSRAFFGAIGVGVFDVIYAIYVKTRAIFAQKRIEESGVFGDINEILDEMEQHPDVKSLVEKMVNDEIKEQGL